MRVLVTGASGYVGRAVVGALVAAGHEPLVRRVELRDAAAVAAAVEGIDAVCHLAGLARVRESIVDPLRYYAVNLGGTLHLLEALATQTRHTGAAGRLVFASAAAL